MMHAVVEIFCLLYWCINCITVGLANFEKNLVLMILGLTWSYFNKDIAVGLFIEIPTTFLWCCLSVRPTMALSVSYPESVHRLSISPIMLISYLLISLDCLSSLVQDTDISRTHSQRRVCWKWINFFSAFILTRHGRHFYLQLQCHSKELISRMSLAGVFVPSVVLHGRLLAQRRTLPMSHPELVLGKLCWVVHNSN